MPSRPRAPHVTLTLPRATLDLYREHEDPLGLPHLSELLERGARQELEDAGVTVPPLPPPPRTAAATRARIQRRRDRRAEGT